MGLSPSQVRVIGFYQLVFTLYICVFFMVVSSGYFRVRINQSHCWEFCVGFC